MWLDGAKFEAVGAALATPATPDVDALLADILARGSSEAAIPASCPNCGRDLVPRPLAAVALFVSACPEGHGAWMPADVFGEFHRFVERELTLAAKKRHRLRVLGRLVALTGLGIAGAAALTLLVVNQWLPLPRAFTPTTLNRQEWVYFQQLMAVLDTGIANRLAMERILSTKTRPEDFRAGYADYRARQRDVVVQLGMLDVPAKLRPVHGHIVAGADRQIEFYDAFVATKVANPAVARVQMRSHPAIVSTDRELRTASGLLRRLYPKLDPKTDEAIDQRLCAFDPLDD